MNQLLDLCIFICIFILVYSIRLIVFEFTILKITSCQFQYLHFYLFSNSYILSIYWFFLHSYFIAFVYGCRQLQPDTPFYILPKYVDYTTIYMISKESQTLSSYFECNCTLNFQLTL